MPGGDGALKLKSMIRKGRSATDASEVTSVHIDSEQSLIPAHFRCRLDDLFGQIEREFENLYAENLTLQDEVKTLQDRLEATGDRFCTHDNTTESSGAKAKKSGSQISQKIKTTYKASTSRIVSSFKTASTGCQFVREYRGHRDGVWEVNVSCTSPQVVGTASADHTARLYCIETGSCVLQYSGHQGSVNSIRFHPNQELVLTGSGDQTAHIWRAQFNLPINVEPMKSHSSGEDDFESSEKDEALEEPDVLHEYMILRTPLLELSGHTGVIIAADWLAGGEQVVTASWDRAANIYDSESGDLVHSLTGHDLELTDVRAHTQQKLVVTSSKDTTFRLWDLRDKSMQVNVFQGHTQPVTTSVFAGTDKIVSGSDDRTVKVWDLKNMRSPIVTIRTDSAVNRLSVHSSNYNIAIPQDNRHVRVHDILGVRLGRLPRSSRQGHNRMVCAATWCGESQNNMCNLFTCGFDRRVFGWSVNLQPKD
ncbi:WD repeat-containing protein 37-like [Tubulanus polymorphus]|uniref:WD repeat-containing protein 37-like n=1 Tax=Tubulanus polymorphus TaxID=672921 RepID=UPI003DA33509